ncbi:hypothetical protein [Streptomyces sp. XD-27]|uniref:hypothetical protein n=1 Tax=Streptomyces sp. XD-27 TaxID=3062779 RepID=UPI0026F42778|nr:hypothetical protein [Streptomyces sp. XD-27]WKX70752.1 hypothetical protein Q3Y56_13295 [Streptomyces sp. XD-27]
MAMTAGLLLGAAGTSAQASGWKWHCSKTVSRTIALPGKPDVTVKAKNCIANGHDGQFNARTVVSWDGGADWFGNKRFNSFKLNSRVEWAGGNRIYSNASLAGSINEKSSGSHSEYIPYTSDRQGKYTMDATLKWDVADDGKGAVTWALPDSPRV